MIEPILFLIAVLPSVVSGTECTDVQSGCRTFAQIINPAIGALISANYLSVHMNISRSDLPWYMKAFEAAKVFMVALFFPDWIFVWALRSFIVALDARKRLEDTRLEAHRRWALHYPIDSLPPACKWRFSQAFNYV